MASEYTITLGGEIQLAEVLNWLSTVPEFKRDDNEVTAPDLQIFINESTGLAVQVIEDEFGFSPSVEVTFRVNKFGDPVTIRKRFIQAVWSLLQHTHEDAVLLYNGQTVILLRIKEQLILNRVEGFWINEVKELIAGHYNFGDIPGI